MIIAKKITTIRGLFYLLAAAQEGSYTRAAAKLSTHQPALSKAIKELEIYTGCKLLNRVAHGVVLTESGKRLCESANKINEVLHYIDNFASDIQQVSGSITLWTTDGFGGFCLPINLKEFYKNHPNISINIICSNEVPNIEKGEVDVGVVYEEPVSSNSCIISQHTMKFGLCASKEFVSLNGMPENLDDLSKNFSLCDRVNYQTVWPEWKNIIKKAKNVKVQTNSSAVFVRMTKEGVGISLQPKIVIKAENDLVPILPEFELCHDFWIISHIGNKDIPKVRSLIDYIKHINEKI